MVLGTGIPRGDGPWNTRRKLTGAPISVRIFLTLAVIPRLVVIEPQQRE